MGQKKSRNTIPWLLAWSISVAAVLIPAAHIQAAEITDDQITLAINADLVTEDQVTANLIDVSTLDGVVTLTGSVSNLLAKDRTEAIAESITGVRAVVNRIEVNPAAIRNDAELAQAVEDAWLTDPATESYQLEASAQEGTVTLSGTADSYQEKKLAETVAKGVWGVRSIDNQIQVDYQSERSDFEIEKEIEARLMNDVRVDDSLVKVTVEDGAVTLTGTVGSLREKQRARLDA